MHLRPCPPVLKTIDYSGVGWGGEHSALRGDSLPLGRVSPGNALPLSDLSGGHPALGQTILGGFWRGDNLHYYTGFPVADNYMYYFDS